MTTTISDVHTYSTLTYSQTQMTPGLSTSESTPSKITLQQARRYFISIGFLKEDGKLALTTPVRSLSLSGLEGLAQIKKQPLKITLDSEVILEKGQYDYFEALRKAYSESLKCEVRLFIRGGAAISQIDPVAYFCEEARTFAKSQNIPEEKLAPYLKCLLQSYTYSDVDWVLKAKGSAEKLIPAKLLHTHALFIKNHSAHANFEAILSKGFLSCTLPQEHPWYPPAPQCLFLSFRSETSKIDLSTGVLNKQALFSYDDFQVELTSSNRSFPQSSETPFWSAVGDRVLKIIRLKKWHITDFRSALTALRHLTQGCALDEKEMTLREILQWGYNAYPKEACAFKVAKAIIKQLKSHSIDPDAYIFNWLLHLDKAEVQVEGVKASLKRLGMTSPLLDFMLDPNTSFDAFSKGLWSLRKMMTLYCDTSGQIFADAEEFGTPYLKLVKNGHTFAFPASFTPAENSVPLDLFHLFLSLDKLERIPETVPLFESHTFPQIPYLLVQISNQQNNTPLGQDLQKNLIVFFENEIFSSNGEQLLRWLTPWIPPINTKKPLRADLLALLTLIKSPYRSLAEKPWKKICSRVYQGDTSLPQHQLFDELASTHPKYAFEIAPYKDREFLYQTCRTILSLKKKISVKEALLWWIEICRETVVPFPEEEKIAQELLSQLNEPSRECFNALLTCPRYGKNLIVKSQEFLENGKLLETVLEALLTTPEEDYKKSLLFLTSAKFRDPKLSLESLTSLLLRAKKEKKLDLVALLIKIALSSPSILLKLKLKETTAQRLLNNSPGILEWIYLLFAADRTKEGENTWKRYLELLDPILHSFEAEQITKKLGVMRPDEAIICCGPLTLPQKDALFQSILQNKRLTLTPHAIYEWWCHKKWPPENEIPLTSKIIGAISREAENSSLKKWTPSIQAAKSLIQRAYTEKRYKDALKTYFTKNSETYPADDPFIAALIEASLLECSPQELKSWLQDTTLRKELASLPTWHQLLEKVITALPDQASFKEKFLSFFTLLQEYKSTLSPEVYLSALQRLSKNTSVEQLSQKIVVTLLENQCYSPLSSLIRNLEGIKDPNPALAKQLIDSTASLIDKAIEEPEYLLRVLDLLRKHHPSILLPGEARAKLLLVLKENLLSAGSEHALSLYLVNQDLLPLTSAHLELFCDVFKLTVSHALLSQLPKLLNHAKPLLSAFRTDPSLLTLFEEIETHPEYAFSLLQTLLPDTADEVLENIFFQKAESFKKWPVAFQLRTLDLFSKEPHTHCLAKNLLESCSLIPSHIAKLAKFIENDAPLLQQLLTRFSNSKELLKEVLPLVFRSLGKNLYEDREACQEAAKALLKFEQPFDLWKAALNFLPTLINLAEDTPLLLSRLLTAFTASPETLLPYLDKLIAFRKESLPLELALECRLSGWAFEYSGALFGAWASDHLSAILERVTEPAPKELETLACVFFKFLKNHLRTIQIPRATAGMQLTALMKWVGNKDTVAKSFLGWLNQIEAPEHFALGISLLSEHKTSCLPLIQKGFPDFFANINEKKESSLNLISISTAETLFALLKEETVVKFPQTPDKTKLQIALWLQLRTSIPFGELAALQSLIVEDIPLVIAYVKIASLEEEEKVWNLALAYVCHYLEKADESHVLTMLFFILQARIGIRPEWIYGDLTKKVSITPSYLMGLRSKFKTDLSTVDKKWADLIFKILNHAHLKITPRGKQFSWILEFFAHFYSELSKQTLPPQACVYFEPLKHFLDLIQAFPSGNAQKRCLTLALSICNHMLPNKWFESLTDYEAIEKRHIQLFAIYAQGATSEGEYTNNFHLMLYQKLSGFFKITSMPPSWPMVIFNQRAHLINHGVPYVDKHLGIYITEICNALVKKIPIDHPNLARFFELCCDLLNVLAKPECGEFYLTLVAQAVEGSVAIDSMSDNAFKKTAKVYVDFEKLFLNHPLWIEHDLSKFRFLFSTQKKTAIKMSPQIAYNEISSLFECLVKFGSWSPFFRAVTLLSEIQEELLFNNSFSSDEKLYRFLFHRLQLSPPDNALTFGKILVAFEKCFEKPFKSDSEILTLHVKEQRALISLQLIEAGLHILRKIKVDINQSIAFLLPLTRLSQSLIDMGYLSGKQAYVRFLGFLSSYNISSFQNLIEERLVQMYSSSTCDLLSLGNSLGFILLGLYLEEMPPQTALLLIEKHIPYAANAYKNQSLPPEDVMQHFILAIVNSVFYTQDLNDLRDEITAKWEAAKLTLKPF